MLKYVVNSLAVASLRWAIQASFFAHCGRDSPLGNNDGGSNVEVPHLRSANARIAGRAFAVLQ